MKRKSHKASRNVLALVGWIALGELAGFIGSFFTVPAIPSWYTKLVRPTFTPPDWLFGPVWVVLYAMMGIAAYFVWEKWEKGRGAGRKHAQTALAIFCFQLILNTTWSIVFFGLKNPGLALVHIFILWFAIIWTIRVFYRVSGEAAYLLVPYLLWVTYATYLTYSIWVLNRAM